MKGKVKRIVSCLLLAATILSSCIQPFVAYAAEPEPEQLISGEDQDVLKEDAAVTVEDDTGEGETVMESADDEAETGQEPEEPADDGAETEQEPEESADDEELLMFAVDMSMTRSSGTATLVRGRKISYPGDLGSYSTSYYTVNGKIAYCLESAKIHQVRMIMLTVFWRAIRICRKHFTMDTADPGILRTNICPHLMKI